MIDALQPVLFMNGFESERVFFDRFTTSTGAPSGPDGVRRKESTRESNLRQTLEKGS